MLISTGVNSGVSRQRKQRQRKRENGERDSAWYELKYVFGRDPGESTGITGYLVRVT